MRTRGERDKIQWTSRNKSVLFFIYTHWQWDIVRQHANGKRVLSEMQPGYGFFSLRNLDMVHGCMFFSFCGDHRFPTISTPLQTRFSSGFMILSLSLIPPLLQKRLGKLVLLHRKITTSLKYH